MSSNMINMAINYYNNYVSNILQLNKTYYDYDYTKLDINYDYIIDIILCNEWESSINIFKEYFDTNYRFNFLERMSVFGCIILFASNKYIKLNHITESDKSRILINRTYFILKDYHPGVSKLLGQFIRQIQKGNISEVKIYLDTFLDQTITKKLKNIYFYAFAEAIYAKKKIKNNEDIKNYNDIIKYVFDKCRTYISERNEEIKNKKVSRQLNKLIFAEYKIRLIILRNASVEVSNILRNRQDITPGLDILYSYKII